MDEHDIRDIRAGLENMLRLSPGKQMKYAEVDVALAYIMQASRDGTAWIFGGYLVLYTVGCDWYSKTPYLVEQLVLRIHNTAIPVKDVVQFLEIRAKAHGCKMCAVGDTQVGAMTKHYLANGFTVIGTQLVKEISDGMVT